MAELDTKDRQKLRKSQFAYVDSKGGEHLPINDESHVRNAISRFNQTDFESATAKASAKRKILAAAKKYGIEVSDDDNVAKPSRTAKGGTKTSTKTSTKSSSKTSAKGSAKSSAKSKPATRKKSS
jgi:hypothetical protein